MPLLGGCHQGRFARVIPGPNGWGVNISPAGHQEPDHIKMPTIGSSDQQGNLIPRCRVQRRVCRRVVCTGLFKFVDIALPGYNQQPVLSSWPYEIIYFWLLGQVLCAAQRREHSRSYMTGVVTKPNA